MKDKTTDELLKDLDHVVHSLKDNLSKHAPIFIGASPNSHPSLDPVKALHLREACLHRITELAESAYDGFKKGNLVTGYLLARAIYETVALFWYFLDQLQASLESGDLEELREILRRMLLGSKIETVKKNVVDILDHSNEASGQSLDPIHVSKLINHVAEKIPPFKEHYDFLCEITHPNAMGLIKAYVKNDFQTGIAYFGKEQGQFASHLGMDLEALIVVVESFVESYNESASLLRNFQENCELQSS